VELGYTVTNFVIAPEKGLPVRLSFAGQKTIEIEVKIGG
jgi:hypothetical protein